jgi:hypothetical protein
LHLDTTLFHQRLETEIDTAKAYAKFFGEYALTNLRRLMQTSKNFELNFLLETS